MFMEEPFGAVSHKPLTDLDIQGVLSQVQLQESGSSVVQDSQTLSLTCAISGDRVSSNSAAWHWVRQPPGKGLQWLGRIYFSSKWCREYAPSLQSRLVIDPDTSKNKFSLELRSVTTEDTAMYYCDPAPLNQQLGEVRAGSEAEQRAGLWDEAATLHTSSISTV
ncbi:Ig heavy chain V-II region WAH [Myotis brandtii]|uniref:Ig heavy chain V-II region WAH n=1 Tax=Myotis brandtii TaxID=109478 RepID=S7MNN9_MYOBR|nr:Ig heavy chain V-II region WAH [Myotis brandtii]